LSTEAKNATFYIRPHLPKVDLPSAGLEYIAVAVGYADWQCDQCGVNAYDVPGIHLLRPITRCNWAVSSGAGRRVAPPARADGRLNIGAELRVFNSALTCLRIQDRRKECEQRENNSFHSKTLGINVLMPSNLDAEWIDA
jgi:hypothetical protein